jgi:hypothetical protein
MELYISALYTILLRGYGSVIFVLTRKVMIYSEVEYQNFDHGEIIS